MGRDGGDHVWRRACEMIAVCWCLRFLGVFALGLNCGGGCASLAGEVGLMRCTEVVILGVDFFG